MAEGPMRTDGFFARGIDAITQRGRLAEHNLPELPDLARLAPPEYQRLPALDQLLAGNALDHHIEAAIRPVIHEPEMLLPRPFARALEEAQQAVCRASERHGSPAVLARAAKLLAQEHEWRELARACREALYQA